MEIYNQFAKVYSTFMGDTPYESWKHFIKEEIQKYNINPKIMCDLGCGIGTLCEAFSSENVEMIGIDNSEEMLIEARENAQKKNLDILYLCQDMSEFELFGTVDVIYCSCDSLNYLLEKDEVIKTFRLVNNYLEKDGLFIFDINTPYKYNEILGEKTFAQQTENAAYIWENYFDEVEQINEYGVTFFIQEPDKRYTKTEEFHYQKAYTIEEIKCFLQEVGLELLGIYDDYTKNPYHEKSVRATFVVRETQSEGKFYTK
ncbi:MAG: methyltransferase [Epulopiscium sp. Nele67-Bin005]|nr:MAG: methyltransferase [Epulopiscium sp. Nele67-Bin005]